MKRIVLFFALIIIALTTYAQEDVRFYRTEIGGNASFCAYQFDSDNYLILLFHDDDEHKLTIEPIVKFQLKDGSVMKLSRTSSNKSSQQIQIYGGDAITGADLHYTTFYITPEDIERLQIGIKKIAINTIPVVYKFTMKSDKIGMHLYKDFKNLKGDFD